MKVDRPTSHILIEVMAPTVSAAQIELVLARCCRTSGDTLLARDQSRDRKSVRFTVLLASEEEQRMHQHLKVLVAALKNGLISFTFIWVPLLLEATFPEYYSCDDLELMMRGFPFKEKGSECYTAIDKERTIYITRPHDYVLDDEQVAWLTQRQAICRVI
jgi:hypothetical protein